MRYPFLLILFVMAIMASSCGNRMEYRRGDIYISATERRGRMLVNEIMVSGDELNKVGRFVDGRFISIKDICNRIRVCYGGLGEYWPETGVVNILGYTIVASNGNIEYVKWCLRDNIAYGNQWEMVPLQLDDAMRLLNISEQNILK